MPTPETPPDSTPPDPSRSNEDADAKDAADAEIVEEAEAEAAELTAAEQLKTHVDTVKNFLRSTAGLAVAESVQFHINMASVAMLAAITQFYVNAKQTAKETAENEHANRCGARKHQDGIREGWIDPGYGE